MYEAFYGFREKPFSIIPDPAFLYFSPKHSMALDLLEYGLINQAGFNVITGEIGTGKTTLVRYLLSQVGRNVTVGLISHTQRSFEKLLQWILFAFNLEWRGKEEIEMFQTFLEFLLQQYGQNKRSVLIVDEAQNMSTDTLEELRMLSNVNADKDQLLQIILVGQPGLRETLRRPDLAQFAQRVAVDYHLEPLDREETPAYIRHRISVAGRNGLELFDDAACDAVHELSDGVPRLVNLLCDTALVYGYADHKPTIDAQIVHDVAREKKKSGIFPSPDRRLRELLREIQKRLKPYFGRLLSESEIYFLIHHTQETKLALETGDWERLRRVLDSAKDDSEITGESRSQYRLHSRFETLWEAFRARAR
jgi:general secretion pathway protein A